MLALYIIGDANGAEKTTVALILFSNFLNTFEYVNADEIARDLSPIAPESMEIVAGRLMLKRLQTLSNPGVISLLKPPSRVVFSPSSREIAGREGIP